MPSLVTSVIGGFQGASAAHNAANAIASGYKQAGQTVTDAAAQVNPDILKTALEAGQGVTGAAATGAQGAFDAAARGGTAATTAADKLSTMLNPYISGGSAAMDQLTGMLGPGGSLTTPFTADMMAKYSPAYQFQLQQGTQAAQRAAAASGMTGSGGTAKALQRYTQDYAGTAFGRANDIYQQLVREHPAVPEYRRDLGMGYRNLGNALWKQEDLANVPETDARARANSIRSGFSSR